MKLGLNVMTISLKMNNCNNEAVFKTHKKLEHSQIQIITVESVKNRATHEIKRTNISQSYISFFED
jgi:outer membrane lipopolysaccharide assembly protein LptE/RlpB